MANYTCIIGKVHVNLVGHSNAPACVHKRTCVCLPMQRAVWATKRASFAEDLLQMKIILLYTLHQPSQNTVFQSVARCRASTPLYTHSTPADSAEYQQIGSSGVECRVFLFLLNTFTRHSSPIGLNPLAVSN